MTSILFAIGCLAILAIIIILVFKPYDYGASVTSFKKIGNQDDVTDTSIITRWRSARIRPGLIACKQVAGLTDQVFLARDVPELPLADCSEKYCRCHYIFHDDRRSGIDRRAELDRLGALLTASARDRRRSPGRRFDDLAPA